MSTKRIAPVDLVAIEAVAGTEPSDRLENLGLELLASREIGRRPPKTFEVLADK